ncbi:hypothetical protein HanRHA438_Chr00c46g0858071 [Helianthus annuus]|uniref:Uncharacterized protein n=1 Tax=Helianthus annuus TaxID=4232 RepID=A0A9K3JEI2_HELAN|nr:hypothetical protein HanXRQr2_Chr03g0105521 [Helianthus annuus]KAJ0592678.1 hypothetical protein HanHA300_Chr03g0087941 [Helianthus annuus]KAJ0607677.1 hypothetical protein HanHA89_Chr03g0099531 [Helianthus annuus]KAJ0767742.1 hypothetical protein HanLR1_Chr03g0092911 [Helianthus annuus]KAJ0773545.1 hypothetical protein HanOQP8_Chr03g0100501 [Helianthus annuus]
MKPLYISTSFNFKCRFDAIYKKYDKYDVKKQRDLIISGDDAFVRLYATVHIETTLQVKGLASEKFAARNDLVQALPDRIQTIPDGGVIAPKQTGGWAVSASRTNNIKFDSGDL